MMEKQYDIVIVGSGAGGGVVAKELAPLCKEGVRIAVLEWGPKFKPEEFTGHELEMASRLYFHGGGMLTKDGSITIAMGKAYGGSTVVYTGTSLMIPEDVLDDWNVHGLFYDDIRNRSEKYFGECNVHEMAPGLINENNKLFKKACDTLGWQCRQFPINVKNCQGAGVCNLGCPHGAKQGTDQVQLPQAEEKGVEVVTNCRVNRIGDRECFATVEESEYGEPSAWEPGNYHIRAKVIVLCTGAIHTPVLMMNSGLPVKLPALGKFLTFHPAMMLMGQHENTISNFQGHPKSYCCEEFIQSEHFILETCMYFPFMTAKSLMGFGREHSEMMSRMDRIQMILALAFDSAKETNCVYPGKDGQPVVEYKLSDEVLASLHQAALASARILFASGASRIHSPAGTKFFIDQQEENLLEKLILKKQMKPGKVSLSTAHVMGGCRMGSDPLNSVTDQWGRVHGLPWLRVADASLFPRCSEVNPYITIMALADRVAEKVREEAGELLH